MFILLLAYVHCNIIIILIQHQRLRTASLKFFSISVKFYSQTPTSVKIFIGVNRFVKKEKFSAWFDSIGASLTR